MSKDMTDEELVRYAQQGNLDALNNLYERYYLATFRRVAFKVPSQDVEDVTQEIFIAMGRSMKSFRFESRFNTWLITLTNRKIADFYRKRDTVVSMDDLPDKMIPTFMIKEGKNIDELLTLKKAFTTLPNDYQEVLLQRFVNDLQFDEIASNIGISLDAVKSRFRRSVTALRTAMLAEEYE